MLLNVLETNAPLEATVVRANHAPYLNRNLRKAIMKRLEFELKYLQICMHCNLFVHQNISYQLLICRVAKNPPVLELLNHFIKSSTVAYRRVDYKKNLAYFQNVVTKLAVTEYPDNFGTNTSILYDTQSILCFRYSKVLEV